MPAPSACIRASKQAVGCRQCYSLGVASDGRVLNKFDGVGVYISAEDCPVVSTQGSEAAGQDTGTKGKRYGDGIYRDGNACANIVRAEAHAKL